MGIFRLSNDTRNALAQKYQELLDGGGNAGTIQIRSGVQPASANGIATGVLLATLLLSKPSAGPPSVGVLTLASIAEDPNASATGTATWARVKNSNGGTVFDCDIGVVGSGATIELNSVSVVAGGPVRLASFAITVPAG